MAKEGKSEKTVEEVILSLPRTEQVIVKKLRNLILECLPAASETVAYGIIPLYRRNRIICYIWPPSIFWGPDRTAATQQVKGVSLGFYHGNLMSRNAALLAEGRKQVYCMYFHSLKEINEQQLCALLFEAGIVDESFSKKKKR